MNDLDLIIKKISTPIQEILTNERVKRDLHSAIFNQGNTCSINAICDDGEVKLIELSKHDKITIISIVVTMGHPDLTLIPLEVTTGIGDFGVTSGIYSVSKCTAKMIYNNLFEMVDVDFYYNRIHCL